MKGPGSAHIVMAVSGVHFRGAMSFCEPKLHVAALRRSGALLLVGAAVLCAASRADAEGLQASVDRSTLTVHRGTLDCTSGGDTCLVANMPQVAQGDRRIDLILDSYLKDYPDDKLPNGRNGPMTRVEARQAMKAGGCYDSSIVTVASAALANRAPQLASLRERTRTFFDLDAVKDAKGRDLPREVHQVSWQYYQALRGQNNVQVDGKRVQPLYLPEIVADIGGGRIREACDPYVYGKCAVATAANGLASSFIVHRPTYDKVADAELIRLMKTGTILLLAYNRLEPVVTFDKAKKTLFVTFKSNQNYHKVAVSGYRPGDYPILVDNVGNAKLESLTISNDFSRIAFQSPDPEDKPKKVVIDPQFAKRPFAIFEGMDKPNTLVRFLDHFDGLRIATSIAAASR
jgi:hypothetical protein